MRSTLIPTIASVLLISLVFANLGLIHTAKRLVSSGIEAQCKRIESAALKLTGEVTRLHAAVGDLRRRLNQLSAAVKSARKVQGSQKQKDKSPSRNGGQTKDKAGVRLRSLDSVKPLTEEERAEVEAFRERLQGLPFDWLVNGDLHGLLKDPKWNPEGRQLTAEELSKLKEAVEDYRFFARTARQLRFEELVRPELERLRSEGAYVEYPRDKPPPAVPGVTITVAEPSEDAGSFRIYYFYPEDYPELYRLAEAEKERAEEAAIRAFLIINGEGERKNNKPDLR